MTMCRNNPSPVPEVEVRLVDPKKHYANEPVGGAKDIVAFLAAESGATTEICHMVCMTLDGRIINHAIVATGDETTVRVPFRKILQIAILSAADLVILAHNHPGTSPPSPSRADDRVTYRLHSALEDCGITLYDCIISNSAGDIYSCRKEKRGPFGKEPDYATHYGPSPGGLIQA